MQFGTEHKHEHQGGHGHDEQGHPISAPAKRKADDRQKILVIASVLGVIIAFVTLRRLSSGGGSSGSTSVPAVASSGVYPSSGAVAGYDSDANAGLQGYLSNLSSQLSSLENQVTDLATPAVPSSAAVVPHLDLGAAASQDTYTRNVDTGEIDQVQSGTGLFYWLSPNEYAAIGTPTPTQYSGGKNILGVRPPVTTPATPTPAAT